MAIGLGIILLLVGLVLVLDVIAYDIPRVADEQLGVLLIVIGIVAILVSLFYSGIITRRRDTRVEHVHDDRI